MVSFSRIMKLVEGPFTGCMSMDHSSGSMREHFMYIHFHLKVAVLHKGSELLLQCDMCGMHIPAGRMIKHRRTAHCFKNMGMSLRRKDVEVTVWCAEM